MLKMLTGIALLIGTTSAMAFDKVQYKALLNEVVQGAISANPNPDDLIAKQQAMINVAKAGIAKYVKTNPNAAPILNEVIASADGMTSLTLDEIEEQWHEYGALHAKGLKPEAFDHFSTELSFMDSIIHPATGIIAVNAFKKDADKEHLEQVKEELTEVLEHLKHIQ